VDLAQTARNCIKASSLSWTYTAAAGTNVGLGELLGTYALGVTERRSAGAITAGELDADAGRLGDRVGDAEIGLLVGLSVPDGGTISLGDGGKTTEGFTERVGVLLSEGDGASSPSTGDGGAFRDLELVLVTEGKNTGVWVGEGGGSTNSTRMLKVQKA